MALDLSAVTQGLNPIGMGLSVLGSIGNIIGAGKQAKEAQRQLDAQRAFAGSQRNALKTGYQDLLSQAKGMPTYQMDLTRYGKAEQAAQNQMAQAQGGRVAGEDLAREQVRQTTANTLAAAQKGAGSASDLLTAALFAQGQENEQMRNITQSSMQTRQQMQQQAQQNYLSTLGQTAAADLQQRGIQFESEYQKQANILGLSKEQLGQSMALEQDLFSQEQAKAAALANANAAIWSGIGGLASNIGGGLMNLQSQQNNMNLLEKLYNVNKTKNTPTVTLGGNLASNFLDKGWMGAINTSITPSPITQLRNPNSIFNQSPNPYYDPVNKEYYQEPPF